MTSPLSRAIHSTLAGLKSTQTGIAISSDNISNAKIETYSAKELSLSTSLFGFVEIQSVNRRGMDDVLQTKVRDGISSEERIRVINDYHDMLQDRLGSTQGGVDLQGKMEELVTSISEASLYPNSQLHRQRVILASQEFATAMSDLSADIQEMRTDADKDLAVTARKAQEVLNQINVANKSIFAQTTAANPDGTRENLLDVLDASANELAKMMDVTVTSRESGTRLITTVGGTILADINVATVDYKQGLTVITPETQPSDFSPFTVSGKDITSLLTGGRAKGLIELRDKILPNIQAELDNITAIVRDTLNELQGKGSGFPPATTLTSSWSVDGELLNGSGMLRVALVSPQGKFVKMATADLSTFTTVNDLATWINSPAGLNQPVASFDVNGFLTLNGGGSGVVLGEGPSTDPAPKVTIGGKSTSVGGFLGFNEIFSTEGKSFKDDVVGIARKIRVNPVLVQSPSLLAFSKLNSSASAAVPPAGSPQDQWAILRDNSAIAREMADQLKVMRRPIGAAGTMAAMTRTPNEYIKEFISHRGQEAIEVNRQYEFSSNLKNDLEKRLRSTSGVDVQEQLGLLMGYNQSHRASVMVFNTTSEVLDDILRMARR